MSITALPTSTIEPNPEFLDGTTPTISWAGKEWPVPLLAPKQNRQVIPAAMRSRASITKVIGGQEPLTTEEYDDLSLIVFYGLKRAHPNLTRDQFDDTPLSIRDLMVAVTVVSQQTGIMKKEDGSAAVGEDIVAKPPQTGTS